MAKGHSRAMRPRGPLALDDRRRAEGMSLAMAKRDAKRKRRHRADLSGYTILVQGTDDPDRIAKTCRALAREFLAWRVRTGRAQAPQKVGEIKD